MSDRRDEDMPVAGADGSFADPFLDEDPEARAREERRRAREEKRRERAGRASLGKRVGGVIDGVADRGRGAIEEAKSRAATPPEPAPQAPEPPPMRRPLGAAAAEPPEQPRLSADEVMPRRERHQAPQPTGITDDFELPPPPVQRRPDASEWTSAGEGSAPPPPPIVRPSGPGGPRPPKQPSGGMPNWLRWLIALVLIALIVVGAVVAVPKLVDRISGDDEPAPIQEQQKPVRTTTLTIPEGYTRAQIAGLAKDAGLKGNYEKETKRAPKAFKAEKKGAPADASLEGFLFPSTYELTRRASVNDLIDQQLTAFNTNIAQVNLKKAKKANLTEYDVVIVASMIEREVMVAEERAVVAAVIYNRLRDGIPLGIDATLRYHLDNFDEPLTESDLATDSPYNTRLAQGLPPTPIANPGLASLEAAANPTNDDYLYYVVKPNTCGEHFFTNDYDEFLAASEEYNSAREAEGKAPTDC